MSVLENLQPKEVFYYFEQLCSIPHGSGNTKMISDFCVDFAKEHNLPYIQDSLNNVIIFKEGTEGYEDSAPVILQGHMDMVCEKEKDCDIDFEKDGLRLLIDDGYVTADGTTLGGDDGIAIAYAMAVLASDSIPHPPIQAVFTVDEEIGLLGAAGLDCTPLTSRIMINLDSEEEGIFWVSCAGGATVICNLPLTREEKTGLTMKLSMDGLAGGHSGAEIDKGGANASVLMGRALYMLSKEVAYDLISVDGGSKDNAIPKAADALILIDAADEAAVVDFAARYQSIFQNEYQVRDPKLIFVTDHQGTQTCQVMDSSSRSKVLTALMNLPNGIQSMSMSIPGPVQTSLNLGILKTKEDALTMTYSARSSVASEKAALIEKVISLTEYLGGTVTVEGDYPAWEYKADSPLRDIMLSSYKDLFDVDPQVQAIHAGLECGLFSGQMPGLDCVSIGPNMKDIHTSDEVLEIASVERVWKLLLEILKRLK